MADAPRPSNTVEQAVLGAMLLSKTSIDVAVRIIGTDPHAFTGKAHQLLYSSLLRLREKEEPVDAISVNKDLVAREEAEEVGGALYLYQLTKAADTRNVERNARHVIFTPAPVTSPHGQWITDVLHDYLDLLEEPDRTPRPNVVTGFKELDELTTGLEPGTLTVISGRPSVGKSMLLGNIACSSALRHAIPTVWIDQESSRQHVLDRVFSAEARVPRHLMRLRMMTDADWGRIAVQMGRVATSPLLIHAGVRVDTEQVRQLAEESGANLVAVDGLQHLKPHRERETREREVSDITRDLKDIALELQVPVVATAHLNRAPLQRFNPLPTLDDLRESDLIAHLADTVILIERPDLRDPESPRAGEADLIIAKHRHGPAETVTVAFQGHYSRFVDMATPEQVKANYRRLEAASRRLRAEGEQK
ncbi:DnaB-like helicase C-terminal domain-containing protein [Nocardiopsis dassonvillei]|uniref:DnaB-like helicase C-terminal domain-containing protein n=1 Tax=Nocardiopsis dassonvillei TaxID=2014 RepID=UPI00157CE1EF|nr:DnaB-like helicase C-terminal domain-containing protein [Nocardiopsis dassonvillei]